MAQITLAELQARGASLTYGAGERFQLWEANAGPPNNDAVKIVWDSVNLNYKEFLLGSFNQDELILALFGTLAVLSFVVGQFPTVTQPTIVMTNGQKNTIQTVINQLTRPT